MRDFIEYNTKFKLGKNAKENHQLIDEYTDINPNYWWFHLDNHPSGHCVIESEEVTNEQIAYASSLVKEYSKQKNMKGVKIIYTQIKNVKKTKVLGQVIILGEAKFIKI